ncbi:hypothetical protein M407DRAFT_19739 [Tulasnella calospora MUT 4182]|uniref:Retrotransposon gag domain-containing protein n=1 Tax=Tulasnella calospora MUT 4182 TaxID=1051891 RepID=A0A0C3QRK8_9AGAM|nr:hypothetical protein M407DRAFT_19739 [Tulasnella calospora MUT 4182]
MNTTEDTSSGNIIFDGTERSDCEAFIIAIRKLAFVQMRDADTWWMLNYATSRLKGKALRWHADLDATTRKEWDLFVRALFEAYPRPSGIKPSDPPEPEIVFRGTDGNECEDFVAAIRQYALAQRKEGDNYWMLQYATTRLRGKALRWHAELDPMIRRDWDLFVRALFKEYPFVEEREENGIVASAW